MKLYPGFDELEDKKKFMMFMRADAGILKNGELEYEASICVSAEDSLIITSKQTGRKFTVSWSDLCNLAVKQGIDSKEPIAAEGVDLGEAFWSHQG